MHCMGHEFRAFHLNFNTAQQHSRIDLIITAAIIFTHGTAVYNAPRIDFADTARPSIRASPCYSPFYHLLDIFKFMFHK